MNFIKKWIRRIANESTAGAEIRTNKLHDMLQNNIAAMVAFKIDNGYIVRTMDEAAYVGERAPGFVYCADHQAIADHLVSSAMRDRLGVQQELFPERKQVNVVRKSQAAGLVGAQQAVTRY
jgi:hypothetical protein